jgi:hypothetical protein
MKLKIGLTWIPRKTEYINRSLQTIGDVDVTIYPDCLDKPDICCFDVVSLGYNIGCFKHYYRVLEHLTKSDADVIGIVSDDVVYCKNWHVKALEHINDGVGFVACYTPKGLADRHGWKTGVHELNLGWAKSWGGCYLFKREVAIELLKHPFILDHLNNYEKNQQIDHAIPEAMYQMELNQLYIVPSLTNHIGVESTIGHKHRDIDKGKGWI